MFTGIIEKTAKVKKVETLDAGGARLIIENPGFTDLELGESIATQGVCLTVTRWDDTEIEFDLSPATLSVTALGGLKSDSRVNLERSLSVGQKMSGHWVQGHVDGLFEVVSSASVGDSCYDLKFKPARESDQMLMRYCISKGSICINGVSLTIQSDLSELNENHVSVQIIPHTWSQTSLSDLYRGNLVNIEVDLVAKYIERFQNYAVPKTQ